ncbi:MAG: hypothetical protein FD122_3504 [Stygiobacter sp.]|nr:MAG: hypothetical protein FD122_3504 [Stygiobacter sp.]
MANVSNYALRLQSSIMDTLRKVAQEEGTTINQFINVAVAEKLSALKTEDYFRERAAKADPDDFMRILNKSKGNEPPREGDELPS